MIKDSHQNYQFSKKNILLAFYQSRSLPVIDMTVPPLEMNVNHQAYQFNYEAEERGLGDEKQKRDNLSRVFDSRWVALLKFYIKEADLIMCTTAMASAKNIRDIRRWAYHSRWKLPDEGAWISKRNSEIHDRPKTVHFWGPNIEYSKHFRGYNVLKKAFKSFNNTFRYLYQIIFLRFPHRYVSN